MARLLLIAALTLSACGAMPDNSPPPPENVPTCHATLDGALSGTLGSCFAAAASSPTMATAFLRITNGMTEVPGVSNPSAELDLQGERLRDGTYGASNASQVSAELFWQGQAYHALTGASVMPADRRGMAEVKVTALGPVDRTGVFGSVTGTFTATLTSDAVPMAQPIVITWTF